jgi:hypothetical protein
MNKMAILSLVFMFCLSGAIYAASIDNADTQEQEKRGTVSGYTVLQNAADHRAQITFELRNPGTTTITANPIADDEDPLVEGTQVTTKSDGWYTLYHVPPGTYDITAKGSKWLRQKQTDVVVQPKNTTELDFTLSGGDANDDNRVNLLDINILKRSYGKSEREAGYDEKADFNNTDSVNILDLNILKSNYGKMGDE